MQGGNWRRKEAAAVFPTDDELRRELAQGPLKRSGFDERLRRRIEERLDEGPVRRPYRPFRMAGLGMGLCVMIAAVVLLIRLHPVSSPEAQPAADSSLPNTSVGTAASMADAEEAHRRSVLLLGLRQDGSDGTASGYRTLLVSGGANSSDWSAAEGEGIIMPYRTDFWRLVVQESPGEDGAIRLVGAYNASRGDAGMLPPIPAGSGSIGPLEERILFAGNRYVALARVNAGEWTYRMMEIVDLAQSRNLKAILSGAERHVVPAVQADGRLGVTETDAPDRLGGIAEWTLARKAGRWVAIGREESAGKPMESGARRELPYALDSAVVAHNELALYWEDIRGVQPAAVDAVTSPARNMAAIVTDRNIVFYSMKHGALDQEMLEMQLKPGETIIMAEWATHADYVDEWMKRVRKLMEEAREIRSQGEQPEEQPAPAEKAMPK
jgi:hypothetical protein